MAALTKTEARGLLHRLVDTMIESTSDDLWEVGFPEQRLTMTNDRTGEAFVLFVGLAPVELEPAPRREEEDDDDDN